LVSHGHADHCIDVPAIAKVTNAVIVAPAEICEHFRTKGRIFNNRLVIAQPFEEISVSGLKIIPFPWGHKEVKLFTLISTILLRGKIVPAFKYAWMNLMEAPFTAPAYGYYLETVGGLGVVNYGEAFSDATKFEAVEALGSRFETDVLIAGVQLDWLEFVAKGAGLLKPRTVILHSPHEMVEKASGIRLISPETCIETVQRVVGHSNVYWAFPGFSKTFTGASGTSSES